MTGNVFIWSKTPANNATADGSINFQEGQLPPSMNNSNRGMMAASANLRDDQGGQLSLAGGTTAYTLTTNSVITALADGIMLAAKVNATNTGAATLAVDGQTAKSIRKGVDTAVAAGDLLIGAHLLLQYNSTLNGAAGGWQIIANSGSQVSSGKLPRSYLAGLAIANGTDATNDINIAVGECRDSTNSVDIVLASALTKQLDAAWAVGTAAGGLDTGSIANTTYHLYLIKRLDTNVVDAIYSASASAPTLPTNYTHYRRIASIVRSGATILAFKQVGDLFAWTTTVADVSAGTIGTSFVDVTLTVPTGIVVEPLVGRLASKAAAQVGIYVSNHTSGPAGGSVSISVTGSFTDVSSATSQSGNSNGGEDFLFTNTSAQIRAVGSTSAIVYSIWTYGYRDRRGREA